MLETLFNGSSIAFKVGFEHIQSNGRVQTIYRTKLSLNCHNPQNKKRNEKKSTPVIKNVSRLSVERDYIGSTDLYLDSNVADQQNGPLGAIRTRDLWLRRPTLYPAELRVVIFKCLLDSMH